MLKILLIIIPALVILYLLVLLFLSFFQTKMIFRLSRNIIGNPSDEGLEYEEINFSSQDGTNLNGWFVPAENAEYTVLFCHGNGGNISHRLGSISMFNKMKLNFFIFDYRGFGKSGGHIAEKGFYEDTSAAWLYLTETKKIAPEKIIILGRSLGAAMGTYAAAKYSPGHLIVESAFTSLPDIAQYRLPWLLGIRMMKYKLPTLKNILKVKCPILILASRDDHVVPFHFSKELFAKAPEPKTFVQLTGDHDSCYFLSRNKYVPALKKFLVTCF